MGRILFSISPIYLYLIQGGKVFCPHLCSPDERISASDIEGGANHFNHLQSPSGSSWWQIDCSTPFLSHAWIRVFSLLSPSPKFTHWKRVPKPSPLKSESLLLQSAEYERTSRIIVTSEQHRTRSCLRLELMMTPWPHGKEESCVFSDLSCSAAWKSRLLSGGPELALLGISCMNLGELLSLVFNGEKKSSTDHGNERS